MTNKHWVVATVYQGVIDDVKIFDDEKTAKSYAKKSSKFVDNPNDFDVWVVQREVKMDDSL